MHTVESQRKGMRYSYSHFTHWPLLSACSIWVLLTVALAFEWLYYTLTCSFQSNSMNTDVGSNISIRCWHITVEWITLIFQYLIEKGLFWLVCLSAGCLQNWWIDFNACWGAVRLLAKEPLIKSWWGSRCSVSSNQTNDFKAEKKVFAISKQFEKPTVF